MTRGQSKFKKKPHNKISENAPSTYIHLYLIKTVPVITSICPSKYTTSLLQSDKNGLDLASNSSNKEN